jgi:hypothetical protein
VVDIRRNGYAVCNISACFSRMDSRAAIADGFNRCGANRLTPMIASWRFKQSHLRFNVSLAVGDIFKGIAFHVLVAPLCPSFASKSRKKFQIRTGRTRFDDIENLVWLPGVPALVQA